MRVVRVAVTLLIVSLACGSSGADAGRIAARFRPEVGGRSTVRAGIPRRRRRRATPRFGTRVGNRSWGSPRSRKSLQAIHDKAVAETRRHAEEFQKLTPEQRAKEVESWKGKPAPWRQQFEDDIRRQIEGLLTPEQLQTIKDDLYPIYAVYALYDAKTREQIGLSPAKPKRSEASSGKDSPRGKRSR